MMTDLWMSVFWTLLITLATILADWIAGRVILLTRGVAQIRRAAEGASGGDPLAQVKSELERIRARQVAGLVWGADLAAVAFGLDLAILGLWMSNSATFPFFQRWDTNGAHRAVGVWLVLLLVHLVILLFSIILRQLHGDHVESYEPAALSEVFGRGWIRQNCWMLASNMIGFLGLLSAFVIVTNAL